MHIGRVHLLEGLYGGGLIPPAVRRELDEQPGFHVFEAVKFEAIHVEGDWTQSESARNSIDE